MAKTLQQQITRLKDTYDYYMSRILAYNSEKNPKAKALLSKEVGFATQRFNEGMDKLNTLGKGTLYRVIYELTTEELSQLSNSPKPMRVEEYFTNITKEDIRLIFQLRGDFLPRTKYTILEIKEVTLKSRIITT